MMKGLVLSSSMIALLGFSSFSANANDEPERNFNIGLTSYVTIIDDPSSRDELSGGGLIATYAFSDRVAARANFGSLEHDSYFNIESDTSELAILLGRNLNQTGFKWYVGAGVFQDKWSVKHSDASQSFNGLLLTGGLGYNWNRVAFDFWLSMRDSSQYEMGGYNLDSAATGGLAISLRF